MTTEATAAASRRALFVLGGLALAIELVLVIGWLWPLALWRYQVNPPDGAPMVTLLGRTSAGMWRFALPATLLIALQFVAVIIAGRTRGQGATLLTLGAAALFAGTLLPLFPGGTQDIFHNVSDGRLLWLYGENPTVVPPAAHPEDAFYRHLFGYNDLTSVYGPLWYLAAGLPTLLAGDGLVANLVAQKALLAAALLALTAVVAVGAAPAWRTRAIVLVGWSPLLLFEFAGNGHNDVLMVALAAAAVLAARRGAVAWVFPLLALSVLVKYTSLLLGPPLLIWLLARRASRPALLGGLLVAVALCVVSYAPFWAGTATVRALDRPGMTFILSPATLLVGALSERWPTDAAERIAYVTTGLLFAVLYGATLWRAARRAGALDDRLFDALFWYLLLASWWFWPWYISWLAPLAAWTAAAGRRWAYVLMTGAGLLSYSYWWRDPLPGTSAWFAWYTALVLAMFVLPLLAWSSGGRWWTRWRQSARGALGESARWTTSE